MIGMAHCQMAGQLIGDSDIDNGFDPYWADVVLLSNFRDTVGSSAFFEEKSQTNLVVVGSGSNPVISSSNGAGNYRSMYMGGLSYNYVRRDLTPGWCTNTTQMTIEFFFRPAAYPSGSYTAKSYYLFGAVEQSFGNDQHIGYRDLSTNEGRFYYQDYASGIGLATTNTFPPGQTYYVKLTFDGSSVKLYINDLLEGSVAISTFWRYGGKAVALGYCFVNGFLYNTRSNGYFDNWRITKAVRPSGLGVVPTKSFPTK